MNDDFCDKCCKCCAVPRLSIAFGVTTIILLGISLIIGFAGPMKDKNCQCDSDDDVCCAEDEIRCGSGECLCIRTNIRESQEPFCDDKDEELETTPLVFAHVFFWPAVVFFILTLASMCCFGHWQTNVGVQGPTLVGLPAMAQTPAASAQPMTSDKA